MHKALVSVIAFVCLMAGWSSLSAAATEPSEVIKVWPSLTLPATTEPATREATDDRGTNRNPNRFVRGITSPTLSVFLPDKRIANGTAIVICPGGGYSGLALDKEGFAIADWMNRMGVAAFVLKYRMPSKDYTGQGDPWPIQDAKQAIRIVRSRCGEWGIKPDHVGIAGFSAGGHVASTVGTHFDLGDSQAADPLARQSCRPDFMILAYPVISMEQTLTHGGSRRNLLGESPSPELVKRFSNEQQVTAQTPPTFLVQAKDDKAVPVQNSILFADALRKAGVPVEIRLYDQGGHGFGLGVNGGDVTQWPAQCEQWMRQQGLLAATAAPAK